MIKSISFVNYRGFKEEQTIHLASEGNFTFLVGANNSGKSLVPRAISMVQKADLPRFEGEERSEILDKDFHLFEDENTIQVSFVFDGKKCAEWAKENNSARSLLNLAEFSDVNLNFRFSKKGKRNDPVIECDFGIDGSWGLLNGIVDDGFYSTKRLEKDIAAKIINGLHYLIRNAVLQFAPIRSFKTEKPINSFESGRQLQDWIRAKKDSAELIKAIKWTNSNLEKLNLPIFNSLRTEGDGQLVLNFPQQLSLEVDDCGTGYSMILILLMEIFRQKRKVIFIDELESHLQPGLIRMVMRLLKELSKDRKIKTTPQIVIATHSPVVVQEFGENDRLFRFQKQEGACKIFPIAPRGEGISDLRSVANELGVLPGDALLSNAVIWVEGPTEVKWLRTWLKFYLPIYRKEKKKSAYLIEGLHYSILMTGGGLIARYAFEEDEESVEEILADTYLKVIRVNPHPFVIIDSDNFQAGSGKEKRAIRIASELNLQNSLHPAFKASTPNEIMDMADARIVPNFWALYGKELENYCPPQLLKDFFQQLGSQKASNVSGFEELKDPDWRVFSSEAGIGRLLSDRGLENVGIKSGALSTQRKNALANYIMDHFTSDHFKLAPEGIISPQKEMIDDLTTGLNKLLDYLYLVNG